MFLLLLCAMVLPTGISSAKIHGKINQYRISESYLVVLKLICQRLCFLLAQIDGDGGRGKEPNQQPCGPHQRQEGGEQAACAVQQQGPRVHDAAVHLRVHVHGPAAACSSGNSNTVACQPPETHITEVFAANCGVELPTVDVISGCHRDRDGPEDALQAVLAAATGNSSTNATQAAALAVIRGKEHTQVGAVFDRAHRRKPFFWCLFFTSGSANSTFLLQRSRSTLVQRRAAARRTPRSHAQRRGVGDG